MHHSWNRGLTKETSASVRKIAETMKRRRIDNFACWRAMMRAAGKIKTHYPPLKKNGDLAELIGVTLGDGHICLYPRTEELRITSNANNAGFIKRYARIIQKVFAKKPSIIKSGQSNATKIGIYEKLISKRLGIPTGARKMLHVRIPLWIFNDKKYIVRYLRGLYEAEGSFCVHRPTCTYKLFFTNSNKSMLNNVFCLIKKLGFHPHRSKNQIQISRRAEVYRAIKILKFRKYD